MTRRGQGLGGSGPRFRGDTGRGSGQRKGLAPVAGGSAPAPCASQGGPSPPRGVQRRGPNHASGGVKSWLRQRFPRPVLRIPLRTLLTMPPDHGVTRYDDYGCRCEVCRTANAERHQQLRAQRAAQRPENEPLPRARHSVDLRQPRLPVRAMRRGTAGSEPAAAEPGSAEHVTPTHQPLGIRCWGDQSSLSSTATSSLSRALVASLHRLGRRARAYAACSADPAR